MTAPSYNFISVRYAMANGLLNVVTASQGWDMITVTVRYNGQLVHQINGAR